MKSNKKTLKFISRNTKRYFPAIIMISAVDVAISLIMIYLAKLSKDIINSPELVYKKAVIIGTFIILQVLLNIVNTVLSVAVSGKITISLRESIFSQIVNKRYSEVSGIHSGDILNRMTSDVSTVVSGAVNIIPSVCSMLSKIIIGTYALIKENYIFAIIVLTLGILLPLVGRAFSRTYKKLHKQVQQSEGKTRSFLQESLENLTVIKTFLSEAPIKTKLNEYMGINLKLRIKQSIFSALISMCLYTFFTLGYYAVVVWGVATGLTFGTLYYLLQLVSILRSPLQNVSGILPRYYSMMASAERILELEEKSDEPNAVEDTEINRLKESFENICVKNLAFSYDNELILKNCDFSIERKKLTVITGESGSGKTTLFKLLLGLYGPTGGSITFDGVTDIDASTRRMFSYVPQGNMILSGSIKDNITLCDKNIPFEKIVSAAKTAEIADFIESLPNKYDTVLSERGSGLSEGQIQRIAIARALLFDAPIILLDEATSALDEPTETKLLQNIKNMTDKTVIFITHRNKPTTACDCILTVKDKVITAAN